MSQILWLTVAVPACWLWVAHAGMATTLTTAGAVILDQQLLAHAADASAAEVKKLIGRGAHVNAQDRFGVTPLMQAVIGHNVAVVRVLLAAGADANLRNLRGDTALDLARQLGRTDIEKLLLAASTVHGP